MSARTIWPHVTTRAAPAPATKRADEGPVTRRVRAEEIARRGDELARGERGAAAEAVAELAGRQRDQEAREA
jgi:hypothetical protein